MSLHLRLGAKIALLVAVVLIVGIIIGGLVLWQAVVERAQDEVSNGAVHLMEMITAVRAYTSTHIRPLLGHHETQPEFIRETVPAFSAKQVFETFRERDGYEGFAYREATLNPTNPVDAADSFEVDLIEEMRRQPDLSEFSGYRTLSGEEVYYSARPLTVVAESCLSCHGEASAAPASMIAAYGSERGFGWQLDEIIGAQVIYVPTQTVMRPARRAFAVTMSIFAGVTALAMLLVNLAVRRWVIVPIQTLADLAGRIGADEMIPEHLQSERFVTVAERKDELGQLAQVFQGMAVEVHHRTQTLRQQVQDLRIEIDGAKRHQQVSEVVDTDFFRDLQAKARSMRSHRHDHDDETTSSNKP